MDLPDKAELLRAAFASDVGLDDAPINTKDGGFVWFDITKVDPAHDLTFDEAKGEVEKQWRDRAGRQGARRQGRRSRQADQGGRERRRRGEERGRRGEVGCRTSIGPSRPALPEAVVAAIFREPADGAGSAATPDGRVVFKVTADTTPPVDFADARVKEMAAQLESSTRESLLDQYVDALAPQTRRHRPPRRALQAAEGS